MGLPPGAQALEGRTPQSAGTPSSVSAPRPSSHRTGFRSAMVQQATVQNNYVADDIYICPADCSATGTPEYCYGSSGILIYLSDGTAVAGNTVESTQLRNCPCFCKPYTHYREPCGRDSNLLGVDPQQSLGMPSTIAAMVDKLQATSSMEAARTLSIWMIPVGPAQEATSS